MIGIIELGMDMKVFAERLKELRKLRNIVADDLALATGVSQSSISSWENCKVIPSADSVYKLAKFFGVTSDYLLGLEE